MILLLLALSLPADFDRTALCDVARAILQEANGDRAKAERIAKERGYSAIKIRAAKTLCK